MGHRGHYETRSQEILAWSAIDLIAGWKLLVQQLDKRHVVGRREMVHAMQSRNKPVPELEERRHDLLVFALRNRQGSLEFQRLSVEWRRMSVEMSPS